MTVLKPLDISSVVESPDAILAFHVRRRVAIRLVNGPRKRGLWISERRKSEVVSIQQIAALQSDLELALNAAWWRRRVVENERLLL
jgi:hypothetical protein